MSNIVPLPTGEDRKRILRQHSKSAEAKRADERPARSPLRGRVTKGLMHSLRFAAQVVGHLVASAIATVLRVIGRPVYALAQIAVIAMIVFAVIEFFRRWTELHALTVLAGAALALVLVHVVIEAMARAIFRFQRNTTARRTL